MATSVQYRQRLAIGSPAQVKRDAASNGDGESCVSYLITNRIPSTKNVTRDWWSAAGSDNDTFKFVVLMPSEAPSVSLQRVEEDVRKFGKW